MTQEDEQNLLSKRRRLNAEFHSENASSKDPGHEKGLARPISPPITRRKSPAVAASWNFENVPNPTESALAAESFSKAQLVVPVNEATVSKSARPTFEASPFRLTKIANLSARQNVGAVELRDILGDPLIKECWNFNYLFDLDFVMKHLDEDVRDMVKVKIVHGFWKRDDGNRIALLEQAERYNNIELLSAYLPDPFGTHHTKMMVLIRHDDTVEVIIHTANMILQDWRNMTQAVWRSPILPLLASSVQSEPRSSRSADQHYAIGSGERFKVDLLHYLHAYEKRLRPLTAQLAAYDFSSVKAAFIGSAPSRHNPSKANPSEHSSFGWLGLQEILSKIPAPQDPSLDSKPNVVIQISSIATLGGSPTWLSNFQKVLAQHANIQVLDSDVFDPSTAKSNISTQQESAANVKTGKAIVPTYNIIFPSPEEIRSSLDGYASGGSIHWKIQSAQQQKQLAYLKPMLCHWKTDPAQHLSPRQQAHRGSAAPHIKTYIRFTDAKHTTIDWAMLTSANLSKQAWGDVPNKKDEIWIQSYEAGVVVWPALFHDANSVADSVVMVPVFGQDEPSLEDAQRSMDGGGYGGSKVDEVLAANTVVALRMPYDLPLSPYTADDQPWCATRQYQEPDWMGRAWSGY
ncbi:hypothetical protein ACN47E_006954 [Coniothyrium glycines]